MTTSAINPVAQIEQLYQRLTKARELVAAGKVTPVLGKEHSYTVASSDSKGVYYVNGECSCPDYQQREDLHKGWCKHRLAAYIFQQEQEAQAEAPAVDNDIDRKLAEIGL